jgi:hypothetical protein
MALFLSAAISLLAFRPERLDVVLFHAVINVCATCSSNFNAIDSAIDSSWQSAHAGDGSEGRLYRLCDEGLELVPQRCVESAALRT